jgi:hypothetical protein
MRWIDYAIDQAGTAWRVEGSWPGEPWQNAQGIPKQQPLYKPGDRFVVNESGWLVRCNPEDKPRD